MNASWAQVATLRDEALRLQKEADAYREEVDSFLALAERIKRICHDHVGCECSAAVMILAVLEGRE